MEDRTALDLLHKLRLAIPIHVSHVFQQFTAVMQFMYYRFCNKAIKRYIFFSFQYYIFEAALGSAVFLDVDSVNLSVYATYWGEVWLWLGADDDENRGSDFTNTKVYPCSS